MKITASGNPRAPFEIKYKNESGERKKKRFKSRLDAEAFVLKLKQESLVPDELKLSTEERVAFFQIKQACIKAGATLQDAVNIVNKNIKQAVVQGKPWNEALGAFFADCERRGCRPSSLNFYKSKIGLFAKKESPENVAKITQERAERYLAYCNSPEHAKRALRAFFNFCKGNKWIASNPFEQAKTPKRIKEKELPHVLTVEQVKTIFENIPADWQPVFALLAFCGIRPNELVPVDGKGGLAISAIDFKGKRISIPAEIAKTRTARIFEPPSNVWAWLKPLKGQGGKEQIAPGSYEVFRRVKDNCGVKIPHDALRHSFGSYGYHYLGAERTVEIMGHVGGFAVFAKHYKGLATPQDAKQYFDIKSA